MAPETKPRMTNEFVETHMATVQKQARQQHKQSQLFSTEDIEQAIWLHMAENFTYVMDKDAQEISKYAYRAAATYCKEQREDFMYFSGSILYSGEMVERILSDAVWVELGPGVDVEGRVDVGRAFEKLPPAQKNVVYRRFALKEPTTDLPRATLERGIHSITNALNSPLRMERVEMAEAARAV